MTGTLSTRFADGDTPLVPSGKYLCGVEQEAGAHASLNIPPPLSARAPHIQVLGKLTLSHRDARGARMKQIREVSKCS
jgi:hypothetical protein